MKPPSATAGDEILGRKLFEAPHADGNTFACATCHALAEPAADGLRRPGHQLGDATRRLRWKNGKSPTFLAAVNSCLEEWMVAPPWKESDREFVALRAFLDRQATAATAPEVRFEIAPPPADLTGGDVAQGRALFDKTCIVCHGAGGEGTERGPRVARSPRAPDYLAKRIRTSGSAKSAVYSDLTGGVMPFWARDRLSDDEVRDLVAFLRHVPAVPDAGGAGDAGEAGDAVAVGDGGDGKPPVDVADAGPPPVAGCGKSHPRVGWRADLGVNTGEGEVSGFVTMIDDCTLELTNFSYNGDGIEVRVFGSKVKTFRPGFTIGPDIVGKRFVKATLRVTLPPGKTLDDLDWVSVWCVRARADFGSGPFLAPVP